MFNTTVNMTGDLTGVAMLVARLNPPTKGHEALIQQLKDVAIRLGVQPVLYIVDGEKSGKDVSKNPLTADQRFILAKRIFPGIKIDVVASAYEALEVLDLQGLKPRAWIAGSDRASNYRKLVISEKLDCEVLEVDRNAGEADGVSATAARAAALAGNMDEFAFHMPGLHKDDLANIAAMICEANNGSQQREYQKS